MLPEERDDRPEQILASTNDVAEQMLAMVVIPPVRDHVSDVEELTKLVQRVGSLRALRHGELGSDLVAGSVSTAVRTACLPHEADREASFSVYKTDHPATELDQPFLLVFRTRHIVTVDIRSDITQ